MTHDVWAEDRTAHITSFWGWGPEAWGTVGYSDSGRRDKIVQQTTDPFICVVYVTKTAPNAEPHLRGKVVGFYHVTHVSGDRDDFTAPDHHELSPKKWRYSLKATRAFEFLPEYRISIDEFDPTIAKRAQSVSRYGEALSKGDRERLLKIPFREVAVYGVAQGYDDKIVFPKDKRGKVRGGNVNRSGYFVEGEPFDTEKELYILKLEGDVSAYLGTTSRDRVIVKIGLSVSPITRRDYFRKSMPEGAFRWQLYRSTRLDDHAPYPNFETAKTGEDAMKDHLASNADHLSGEFYASTAEVLNEAWEIGRRAALSYHRSN